MKDLALCGVLLRGCSYNPPDACFPIREIGRCLGPCMVRMCKGCSWLEENTVSSQKELGKTTNERRWGLNSTLRNGQEFGGWGCEWRDHSRWREEQEEKRERMGWIWGTMSSLQLGVDGKKAQPDDPWMSRPHCGWLLPYYLLMLYNNYHSSSFPRQT